MPNQSIVEAVRRGDWDVIHAVPADPSRLAADLEAALPQLDDEGSQIAALVAGRHPGPGTEHLMLVLVQSMHLQAAAEAAAALSRLPSVPVAGLAAALPQVRDPMVRGLLYLAIGRSPDTAALALLRLQLTGERDAAAAAQGEAAAARLGGKPERAAFFDRVRSAGAANAKDVYDELVYVGDARFGKALLPWLDSNEPATRIGRDADGRSARMCDLAVWTAKQIGVNVPGSITRLDRFDDATIQATRAALQQLGAP
jgi:hypothetical protein